MSNAIIQKVAAMTRQINEIPQIKRGQVWCTKCGATESVKGRDCLSTGWPMCCGETMTIDSPEERAARTKATP